jgi:hypothetical protein
MELYIRIKDGQPFEHPILGDNFRQAFSEIDINNLPEEFARFERIPAPTLGVYEVNEGVQYQRVGDVIKDVWTVRQMTAEEKSAKQQAVRDAFNSREQASNWSAWILDEATCTMVPPIPRPAPVDGKIVFWCGAENNWKEIPTRPEGQYKFDFFAWNWVAE